MVNPKDLKIAYIGGGSRGWAWTFMTDLALESGLSGTVRLYDIDAGAAEKNEIIGNNISASGAAPGKWVYEAADTLKDALAGADFVIISILPGTFAEMKSDVHLPERLGIYQSVGDTAGPGGIIRGLRTVPVFTGFAEAVREYSPKAWVINYTNPMSLCVRALYHAFPQIKAFGCCHEVFGTQELLAAMARRNLGEQSIKRRDIHVNVMGLNHFTWFDRASFRGYDLMEMFRDFSEEFYETGFKTGGENFPDKVFTCGNRVKFDLFKRYNLIAAAGDRHLAEFMPGGEYLRDSQTPEKWGFYLTSVDWRIGDLQNRLKKSERLVSGMEASELKASGEEGILLIKALCGLTRVVSNVNLPNAYAQISNLPKDTVVETNALFSADDVRPVAAGALPDGLYSLILPHAENQSETVAAALNCDRQAVYRAFCRDALAGGGRDEGDLRKLADDMIENTLKYLPEGWK